MSAASSFCSRASAAGCSVRGTWRGAPTAMTMRENGHGSTNLSHWKSVARLAANAIGRIGRCDICDSRIAPGLNTKRGPFGPSGVIDGEMPCFVNAS